MATSKSNEPNAKGFVDDYLAGWDDDPFGSPSPEPASKKNDGNDKKRKGADILGIDEQVDVVKRARAPRPKLDETRLLSEKGIPKLRKLGPRLKLKGKGHEFSDAARLLSFYQEWLDDLFPKATFLDALAMIEKTGHKVIIRNERLKWIEEGKPRSQAYEEDEFRERQTDPDKQPTRIAPIFESARQAREKTPANDDLFGDDDIYNATPRARPKAVQPADDTPDDDELMALMAEQEAAAAPTFGSIFGGGASQKPSQPSRIPDDDDLDALMAEAEAQTVSQPPARISIFGGGGPTPKTAPPVNEEYDDDLEALMAMEEAEAGLQAAKAKPPNKALPAVKPSVGDDKTAEPLANDAQNEVDALDALMAEAEAETSASKAGPPSAANETQGPSAEEEEAMAEMEGLW